MPYKNPKGPTGTRTRKATVTLAVGGRGEITQLSAWFEELDRSIQMLKRNLKGDLTPLWKEAQPIVMSEINKIFETEGQDVDNSSLKWPPLNKRYAARKKMAVGNRKMLVWSGVMKASIVVERKTPNSLKITARDPKARLHHFGLKPPGAQHPLPARPFMYLTRDAQEAIMLIVSGMADAALRGEKRRKWRAMGARQLDWQVGR